MSSTSSKQSSQERPPRNPATDMWQRGKFKFSSKYESPPLVDEIEVTSPPTSSEADATDTASQAEPDLDFSAVGKFVFQALFAPRAPSFVAAIRDEHVRHVASAVAAQHTNVILGTTWGVPVVLFALLRKWRLRPRLLVAFVPGLVLGHSVGRVKEAFAIRRNVAQLDYLPDWWPEHQRPAVLQRVLAEEQRALAEQERLERIQIEQSILVEQEKQRQQQQQQQQQRR